VDAVCCARAPPRSASLRTAIENEAIASAGMIPAAQVAVFVTGVARDRRTHARPGGGCRVAHDGPSL
jgi:hypothetical protein